MVNAKGRWWEKVYLLPSKNFKGPDFLMATALDLPVLKRDGWKANNTVGRTNSKLVINFISNQTFLMLV